MQLEHLSKSSIYVDPFQSPTRNQTEISLYNISTPTHVIKMKRKYTQFSGKNFLKNLWQTVQRSDVENRKAKE